MQHRSFDFKKAEQLIREYLQASLKTKIGVEAVNFFRKNFEKQGFPGRNIGMSQKKKPKKILHT